MDTVVQEIEFTTAMPTTAQPVVTTMPQAPAALQELAADPILTMIERAARDPSVDIEKMDRLLQMKERVDAKAAQIQFDNAMADAQEDMKAIRADLFNKQTQSHYASYAQLDKATRPIYARHGFSLSFDTAPASDNCVRIVCTVAHRSGHREVRQIEMPADGKGAKGGDVMTRTHATGAAASYGQRYLLKLIFNLAVGDVDDDGNGAAGGDDGDIDRMATGPRDPETGKPLSTYDVAKIQRAKDIADRIVQAINLSPNREAAKEIWAAEMVVPKGKRSSPLGWLKDNAPGQHLRCQTVYENVVGLE